jgi:hypothetical protein
MNIKIQKKTLIFFIFLELALFIIFFSFFPEGVFAGVGENNVTVITNLTVGNVFPEMSNVSIENNASTFALTPNSSKTVTCVGIATDYNGWNDVKNASAAFFDNALSSYAAADDNNLHYTNSSCLIAQYDGDPYTNWINCTFNVWYYANVGIWNCTILVNDTKGKAGYGNDVMNISSLLALGLPDIIYYGEVNATEVSSENLTNVTNYGNVKINLSLSGYGFKANDGNAMNCTIGATKNITIINEKYNLTNSNPGVLDLGQFIQNYTNLTSAPTVKRYNLNYRQNDTFNEAINATYWRIYVPMGVGGTCQGNIVFGATVAPGT